MHTIKLKVNDNIYEHIIFLLKSLNPQELEIIEDKQVEKKLAGQAEDILALLKTKRYANHPKSNSIDVEQRISALRNDWDRD